MVEKSNFNIFILIFTAIVFPQDFLWENAEDFVQFIFELEQEGLGSNNYSHRIRMLPSNNDDSWQQKIYWNNSKIKTGWRIDKPTDADSVQNRKGFLALKYNNYHFIFGNVQIQTGNSLIFGSDYNGIKSPNNITASGKIKWQINPYLGSQSSSNPRGVYLLKNTGKVNFHFGLEKSAFSSSAQRRWGNLYIITAGHFINNNNPALSISYLYKAHHLNFSGETAYRSGSVAQYFQLFSNQSKFKWLGQIRLLPQSWETIYGQPFSGFSAGKNEIGVLFSVRTTINNLTLFAWADIFKELGSDHSLVPKSGNDFLSGFRFRQKYLGIIEFKFRRKLLNSLQNMENVFFFRDESKTYYTITVKNKLVLKWKFIQILPQNDMGQLYQVQSLKINKGKWSTVFGAVYFDSNNWDSRLYLIEPGLKGEFRIKPYYGRGTSLYSKFSWKINGTNILSFRQSLNMKFAELLLEPETGLQLDIVF